MKNILVIIAITATLAASAQVPNYVPTNGLVGWWGFNGNANDESGNGNNGTLNGSVSLTTDRNGNPNSAYSFPGSSSAFININQNASFSNFSDGFTLSAWYLSSVSSSSGRVIALGNSDSGSSSNAFHISGFSTTGIVIRIPSIPIAFGQWNNAVQGQTIETWYNLILSVDFSNASYVIHHNGTIVDSGQYNTNLSFPIDLANQVFNVGRKVVGAFDPWNGKIDDIGIWNRALTQCEIKDLYNSQLNSVNVSAGNDLTVCEGDEIVLSGSGADSYSWNNGVLDSIPFVATNTSEYVVVGTDTLGCLGTDTMQVNVLSTSSSSQNETSLDSYVWSVNGQTYTQSGTYTDTLLNVLGCDSIVTLNLDLNFTGIESDNNNEFNVFPNPINELLTIINSSNASKNIKLIDKQGRLVLESIISKETNTINLAHLESGNYLLFIEGNDSPIQIIKK